MVLARGGLKMLEAGGGQVQKTRAGRGNGMTGREAAWPLPRHCGRRDDALVAARQQLTLAGIPRLGNTPGIEARRLRLDMEAPENRAAIERDRALADALGITGTPAFVVRSELVPGALELHALKALVSQVRAK